MGLDFVGVGGYAGYLPFLRFAEALNIPWLIFSDAEISPDDVKGNVSRQFSKCGSLKREADCIVFLDNGYNFEKQLIHDGYGDEIKQAILSLDHYCNEQHRAAKEKIRADEIEQYQDEELYNVITGCKTQYGPAVAEQIIQSEKQLPPKIIALFTKIAAIFKMEEGEV